MGKRRPRLRCLALSALVALSPCLPSASPTAAVPVDQQSATTVTNGSEIENLVAYRLSLLLKQQTAVAVRTATTKAIHKHLGYAPGTTDPREIARQIMANKYNWGEDQYSCYHKIIMRESKWDPFADNPRSSAYGIPQALPGKRMAAFGADWRTNPVTQIRWGLDYVDQRYGTPCRAWTFKRARGWY